MPRLPGLTVALLLAAGPLAAQQATSQDSLLERTIGRWVLRGTIAGQQTTHDVTFEWVLNRGYVRMHEVSRERTPDGTPQYEAIVYFMRDTTTHRYAAMWLDNTGVAPFPQEGVGHGTAAGDSIPFVFGTPEDGIHNTFVYDRRADTWQWHLDNMRSGVPSEFARVTLTRARRSAR